MDKNLIINLILLVIFIWFVYSRFAGVKGLKNLRADQFKDEMQKDRNKMLIDVREPHEFKQGYIPGAVNIPLSQLNQRVKDIPKEKQVYLYCRSGMRSKQAAKVLLKNGFAQLAHLQGGISAWNGKISK